MSLNQISVRYEIDELCKRNNITKEFLSEVNKYQWESILYNIEERFLTKAHYSHNLHWGWNRFREPNYASALKPYKCFTEIIEDEYIWFLAEDVYDKIWIYEGNSKFIFEQVIPELCQLREYYLVSKKYHWIVCEDHHRILHFQGNDVVERMIRFEKKYKTK
ncbi:DUF6756 family protein [Paenibacillus xylanilyticus]|uniref:Uncharacterized protein n=1 Tax=Paenibacillus xylanilyticus TaxID=248903 RepID=A0A7Y6EYF1_9BACL|nr:DUF6756 family protein [Paenibacillus xylanilyticus]NUU78803.1 hypothetical protein [Paenibacillus xylanilyticus]